MKNLHPNEIYKKCLFTPFRSFLHPQIQRMNNLWKNEDQETEELLINNYETEDFDSENKEYNITYHS
ncbi:Pv-fam-c protein [Plasmodium ovale wallikeri]|uniref:Pv-fam-c protein n=1 Tax=Plasmodium ovale wallikeri TaxID=864142 RepID=A0A1A9AGH1_PLAOA|nr:Pv-fam-c protein [Plasmodium ovale wallikeri]